MKLSDAVFYHIYPLGALGVLDGARRYGPGSFQNSPEGSGSEEAPLMRILEWMRPMRQIGANILYLGPLFESEWHGYETIDHRKVDSRLGSNDDLKALSLALQEQGISLVLDAVFNHVGRTHPVVQDIAARGNASPFRGWISGYDPNRKNGGGLPFSYDTWAGHCNLVRLDTSNPKVQDYLLATVMYWIDEFAVAGLRLDAADCLDLGFLGRLSAACRAKREDFILIGEAVHGDHYQRLLREGALSSVTNYEAYKGLWSSYNDRNYFEISWTLDRLFGDRGLCKGSLLYSFADNHDVDRVSSLIRDPAGLYPLYGLLFSMPGIPSVYYGSEYGIGGKKQKGDDSGLRPRLDPAVFAFSSPHPHLAAAITRFANARQRSDALRSGGYRLLHVEAEGLAFIRTLGERPVVVGINGSGREMRFCITAAEMMDKPGADLLDYGYRVRFDSAGKAVFSVPPNWVRWIGIL